MPDPALTRRSFLAAAVLVTSGCTLSDPTISGPRPTQLTPSPRPALPGAVEAAAREEKARLLALGLAHRAAADDDERAAARWTAVADAHRLHAEVWRAEDPPARRVGPTASPSAQPSSAPTVAKKDVDARTKELRRHETLIREQSLVQSLAASGPAALLWASTAAFAAAAPTLGARGSIAKPSEQPPPPQVATEAEAVSGLLGQVYAMIYGYQAAAGPLDYGSDDRTTTLARLTELEALRAELSDALASGGHAVPDAAPAYRLPVTPTDAGSSRQLRRRLETALLPWVGGWVAATADESTGKRAGALLTSGTTLVATLGGQVPVWPGFVD